MGGIVKGSLVNYDDGTRLEFMFNPTNINDKKAINWGRTQVPHVSHPVMQFGSGGERAISFQLYLDGDRGQLAYGGQNGIDVSPTVRLYRALLYPASLESGQGVGAGDSSPYWVAKPPSRVIFNYGPFWTEVLCNVTQCDLSASFFSPAGEIVRCTLDIGLEETPSLPVFANDVRAAYSSSGNTGGNGGVLV